ncbi:MAG: SAM-dependent methyltransferase, partial [Thiobacillus sp.]
MNEATHHTRLPPGLYVVATPIGNLGDITLRALDTLKCVDRVAAEDTRVSGQLLAHFDIRKPLVSIREHNERAAAEKVIAWIAGGEAVAYVSDAGTP